MTKSLVHVLRDQAFVLVPLDGDVLAQRVQLLSRLLVVVALSRKAYSHTAWHRLDALAPQKFVQLGIHTYILHIVTHERFAHTEHDVDGFR